MGSSEDHRSELAQQMLGHLLCTRRRTVTGLLAALGRDQQDWTKAYRLYREHVDNAELFVPILDGVLRLLPEDSALVIAVDDSHLRKTGRHVAGAGWYKDPLGPPFHVNLMYAQRFIQLSAAVPDPANPKRARMIPIAMELIPKLPKPGRDASAEDVEHYEKLKVLNSPGMHARRLLQRVRDHMDGSGEYRERAIRVCGDGHYSTSTLMPHLPPRTVYIGRTRSDMSLRSVPRERQRRSVGRPRSYGKQLSTPDECRRDKAVPWQELTIDNGHNALRVRYKRISKARWHVLGEEAVVQVVVVAPMRYRKRKNGPWRYTEPAYLVCTDANMPVGELLQIYYWRWGIEVNFREEKQLFGAGQAQVRNPSSVSAAPAVCIATYAALLLAGIRAYGFSAKPPTASPPKWYRRKARLRVTSSDLIKQLHREMMLSTAANFSPLIFRTTPKRNSEKAPEGNTA